MGKRTQNYTATGEEKRGEEEKKDGEKKGRHKENSSRASNQNNQKIPVQKTGLVGKRALWKDSTRVKNWWLRAKQLPGWTYRNWNNVSRKVGD